MLGSMQKRTTEHKTGLISVIIVNWNGQKWLKDCFDSLIAQTYQNVEIIMVDNGSSDNSVEYTKTHYPAVQCVLSETNLGFAGGNNLGLKHASGEYILLLNNDTAMPRDCLANFVKAFEEVPNLGSAQAKLVLMDDHHKLDTCGSYWTSSTFVYNYGYRKNADLKKYNTAKPFFSNKGAAMLIKREVIDKVGLFDDDFWCYYEETDLCHRIWLSGFECWYWPDATVYHALGSTADVFANDYIQFHNFKNKLCSYLKNFEALSLLTIVPTYMVGVITLSLAWLVQGKVGHFTAIYRGLWWNIVHLQRTLAKRRAVQQLRVISDKELLAKVKKNPHIRYYYYLFTLLENYHDRI